MPSITGNEIVGDAFAILNVFMPGETVPPNQGQFARRFLNDWIGELGQRDLFIPIISRERFDTVANQGGPDNPYTIGPGGNWDTERPSNQNSIVAANLILTSTSPEVRVPLGIYTDDAYDSNPLPSMTNTQPTGLYYNPYYNNDLGKVYLWPVPTTSINDVELFLQKSIAPFANLSTPYWVPDGVVRMMKYNLADMLQVPFGRELSQKAQQIAISSMSTFKRANTKLSDLANDVTFTAFRRTLYNINTGAGG